MPQHPSAFLLLAAGPRSNPRAAFRSELRLPAEPQRQPPASPPFAELLLLPLLPAERALGLLATPLSVPCRRKPCSQFLLSIVLPPRSGSRSPFPASLPLQLKTRSRAAGGVPRRRWPAIRGSSLRLLPAYAPLRQGSGWRPRPGRPVLLRPGSPWRAPFLRLPQLLRGHCQEFRQRCAAILPVPHRGRRRRAKAALPNRA